MRVGVAYESRISITGNEECFHSPVVEASSDPGRFQCKNLSDQASVLEVMQSNWKWNWVEAIQGDVNKVY